MAVLNFSDQDIAALQATVRAMQQQLGNRSDLSRRDRENEDHQAPEIYIAKTPSGGIPARSTTTPGSAVCTIQKTTGVFGSETLEETSGYQVTVFNISTDEIEADVYILIKRDKYGVWVADVGGGGTGAVSIWFTIDSVSCNESNERVLIVTPHRVAPPCTDPLPGEDSYGDVEVYDDGFGCILNEYTDDELIGLSGRATWASDVDVSGEACIKRWTLDGLCDTGTC